MKRWKIKPEYYDLWFGGESVDPDHIVTPDELDMCSRGWDKPVEELLEQLEEVTD